MTTTHSNAEVGVLIVDDHAGYRSAASEVIAATGGFFTIGSAADRDQALALLRHCRDRVGLILMDVHLGADDGISLVREIVSDHHCLDVVLVTTLAIDDLPTAAFTCGARGYLPKSELSPKALTQVGCGVYDWPDVQPARGAGR